MNPSRGLSRIESAALEIVLPAKLGMSGIRSGRRELGVQTNRQVAARTSASFFTFVSLVGSLILLGCPLPSLTVEGKRCRSGECPAPYECLSLTAAGEGVCGRADGGDARCGSEAGPTVHLLSAEVADSGEFSVVRVDGGYLALYLGPELAGGTPSQAFLQRFDSAFMPQGQPMAVSTPGMPVGRLTLASRGSTLATGWMEPLAVGTRVNISGWDESLRKRSSTLLHSPGKISTPLKVGISVDQTVVMAAWGESRDGGAALLAATINEEDGGILGLKALKFWPVADLDIAPTGASQFILGVVRAGVSTVFLSCGGDLQNIPPQREFASDGGVGQLRLARREGALPGASDVTAVWTETRTVERSGLQTALFVAHEPLLAARPQAIFISVLNEPQFISSLQAVGVSATAAFVSWAPAVGSEAATLQGAMVSIDGTVGHQRQIWAGENGVSISTIVARGSKDLTVVVSTPTGVDAANVCVE